MSYAAVINQCYDEAVRPIDYKTKKKVRLQKIFCQWLSSIAVNIQYICIMLK